MKIVIINQPTNNRGDEAAHKSLVRALIKKFPNAKIDVYVNTYKKESVKEISIVHSNINYHFLKLFRGERIIAKYGIKHNFILYIACILPGYINMILKIKSCDYLINAPGGICMGGFQNWIHLFNLLIAKQLRKKIAYFSRSIGPFSEKSDDDFLFKRKSIELLQYFSYISLRDKKSIILAKELGISVVESIDAAFIDIPKKEEINILTHISNKFIVFVPNSLSWHPAYKNISRNFTISIFEIILDETIDLFPDFKIILLPQLFKQGQNNDFLFFTLIKEKSKHKEHIIILDDSTNSDIQQNIISHSELVIGARYHSIVFAINNNVPFISLSYEHKMTGLLSILGASDQEVDLTKIGESDFDLHKFRIEYRSKLESITQSNKIKLLAQSIANKTFNSLCENFLKVN